MTEFDPPVWLSYDVAGDTLDNVASALSQLAEAGEATWTPTYTQSHDAAGTVTRVAVRCGFTVRMPRWTGYDGASPAMRREWDRWWKALEAHEQEHVAIVTRTLTGIEDRMVGRPVDEADSVFQAAVAMAAAESDDFDRLTSHGEAAGTVMDTSIR